jgi:hypothetical protein
MSDTILSPDVSIPAGSVDDPTSPYRLCEYDEGAVSGCRRTQTILALEAEYDTFVDPEMHWDPLDQWCRHEDNIYFHKLRLENLLNLDKTTTDADNTNQELVAKVQSVELFAGSNIHSTHTLEEIYQLFRTPPAGFVKVQLETPQFFQCKDVGSNQITIDGLTREILNKIQSTFTDDENPLLVNLAQCLYLDGDDIICTNFLAFKQNPTAKLGVLMIPNESAKYMIGDAYFFPFAPLTDEQTAFITDLVSLDIPGNTVIVNL